MPGHLVCLFASDRASTTSVTHDTRGTGCGSRVRNCAAEPRRRWRRGFGMVNNVLAGRGGIDTRGVWQRAYKNRWGLWTGWSVARAAGGRGTGNVVAILRQSQRFFQLVWIGVCGYCDCAAVSAVPACDPSFLLGLWCSSLTSLRRPALRQGRLEGGSCLTSIARRTTPKNQQRLCFEPTTATKDELIR